MTKTKEKKNLPDDFQKIMERGDFEEIKEVFQDKEMVKYLRDVKEIEQRNDSPFLYYSPCTEIYKWFTEQGFDVHLGNKYYRPPIHEHAVSGRNNVEGILLAGGAIEARYMGKTPLHTSAEAILPSSLRVLIKYGADVHAKTSRGKEALELLFEHWEHSRVVAAAECMELLINAGAGTKDWMRAKIIDICKDFDRYKGSIHADNLQSCEEAMTCICRLLGVERPASAVHDGKSLITVTSTDWRDRHEELWNMLVPGRGKCKTVQGEVIRIGGRIHVEIFHNGGGNWDNEYRKMLNALKKYYVMGKIPDEEEHREALALIKSIGRNSDGADVLRLCEINIHWVLANPEPILLGDVDYSR